MKEGNDIGVMVCGHGTRDVDGVAQFSDLARQLQERFPQWPLEHGYLEFAKPLISEGLEKLRMRGVEKILAIPGLLFAAGHAKNDIPALLNDWNREQRELGHRVAAYYGRELGLTSEVLRAAYDRIGEAVGSVEGYDATDTLLVTVGRGASDPDANSNVAKVSRLLQEYFGFGWSMVAYSGVTFPLVMPALEHAVKLGFSRILVFPYFLFTGRLVERIYDHTDRVARQHPEVEFVKVSYLNDHPGVIRGFEARILEILDGAPEMNCQLCKYRTPLPSFEGEVGAPQVSHHHHVEGVGTDGSKAADAGEHHHPHHHSHSHHAPYPHRDHPLGPKSLPSSSRNPAS